MFIYVNGQVDKLRQPSPLFDVEEGDGGFVLSGKGQEFSDLVREAVEASSDDFVALPVPDGHTGCERCVIIPL